MRNEEKVRIGVKLWTSFKESFRLPDELIELFKNEVIILLIK
jgi:hypothetical protein